MTKHLSPEQAKARIHEGDEHAFLDVREAGPFSEGHPLFAVPCPWSLFEDRVRHIVPRRDVPVMLIDGGDGIAGRAARALTAMDYTDISVVEGGTPAWAQAGLRLYKGVNVPSKTLGELAEHVWHPRTIGPETLAKWKEEGRAMHFFDTRPPAEYSKMMIPGAACVPNGELAHRMPAAVADEAPIVLTCAGRTRGIIGALGLGRFFPEREIYALENGTQGWALSGRELLRGNTADPMPALDGAAAEETRTRADAFMDDEGIPRTTAAQVSVMLEEPDRTTFLFDVRSAGEAADDPLAAFTHALSGQIVQATDHWVGVRHARIVLADDLGARAALAAFWLGRLGYEVWVARIDDALRALPPRQLPVLAVEDVPTTRAQDALAAVKRGEGRFIDVRQSDAYRAGHVAGAVWGTRPELEALPVARGEHVFVIGDDSARGVLAAREFLERGHGRVSLVEGGSDALKAAGAAFEATPNTPPVLESPDVTWFAHGRHDGDLDASRTYLAWETGLIEQLAPEERAEFAL
ncbi:rhodanese [Rhodobacteraceae bacterium WD3A24]|nr:rhodanese [Rhodobacteraceae bacterium WD3A24]